MNAVGIVFINVMQYVLDLDCYCFVQILHVVLAQGWRGCRRVGCFYQPPDISELIFKKYHTGILIFFVILRTRRNDTE